MTLGKYLFCALLFLSCGTLYADTKGEGSVTVGPCGVSITITVNSCSQVTLHVNPGAPAFTPTPSPIDSLPVAAEYPPSRSRMSRLLAGEQASPAGASWWQRVRAAVDDFAPELRITINERTASLREYIKHNWMMLGGEALLAGYAYINYVMFRLVSYLQSPDRWFYWKHDLPLGKFIMTTPRELLVEMIAVGRLRQDKGTPVLLTILAELEAERAALERYRTLVSRIYMVDDMQQQCAYLCEKCMPSWVGLPIGCFVRALVSYLGARRIVYCNDALMKSSTEYLAKIEHLKDIVTEALNSH